MIFLKDRFAQRPSLHSALGIALGSVLALLCSATSTIAATTISFRYGLFEQQLPIADLEDYANNEDPSSALALILNFLDPQETWFRATLQQSYRLDNNPNLNLQKIDQLVTSPEGGLVLERLGEVFQPESQSQNGHLALRAAVLLAASNAPDLTLIEVLRQFPVDTLAVDVAKVDALLLNIVRLERLGVVPELFSDSGRLPFSVDIDQTTEADLLLQEGLALAWLRGLQPQGLTKLEESLALRRQLGDRPGEAATLLALSFFYNTFRASHQDFDIAIDYGQQALEIFQELELQDGEGLTTSNIGYALFRQDKFAEALDYYQHSLETYPSHLDSTQPFTSTALIRLALPPLGEDLSLDKLVQGIHQYVGKGVALHQVGQIYRRLNQNEQALEYFQQSLAHHQSTGFLNQQAVLRHGIGKIYLRMGQYNLALDNLLDAVEVYRQAQDESAASAQQSIGGNSFFYPQGEGWLTWDIAAVYLAQGNHDASIQTAGGSYPLATYYRDYVGALPSTGNSHKYKALAFHNLGLIAESRNDYGEAIAHYQQALAHLGDLGLTYEQGLTLARLGDIYAVQEQPEVAISFYKESVNRFESVRENTLSLSLATQQSYISVIADHYRNLADLLLQQDRILEAQRVLDLLKVQELETYLQGVRSTGQPQSGVELLPPETAIINHTIRTGYNLVQLRAIPFAQLTEAQKQEIHELEMAQQAIIDDFEGFITSPEIRTLVAQLSTEAQEHDLLAELDEFINLQNNLRAIDQNAVLIYPLILKDRLELVLVTPFSEPSRYPVEVSRTELNQAIVDFRRRLNVPVRDPKPEAQTLYNWLIAPMANDLEAIGAETILYAPDGPLRYVPLAALHDGTHWLTEQFRVNHITAASLQDFTLRPDPSPTVLAGAFSEGAHTVQAGERRFPFRGLPFAGREVQNLAAMFPGTTQLVNEDFSRSVTELAMDSHTIIHLATHAAFVGGAPNDSFILFGNGDHVTLEEIKGWRGRFNQVDLVVLSACETGLGVRNFHLPVATTNPLSEVGNGEEILGFGYLMQEAGAEAAIASLWKVSDGGTQTLMDAFYTALNNGYSKAEALRRAQVALIRNDTSGLNRVDHDLGEDSDQGVSLTFADNPELQGRLNHPYYWAPFILIGNGL